MKLNYVILLVFALVLGACSKVSQVKSSLENVSLELESSTYKMGQTIELPQDLKSECKSINLRFGDQLVSDFKITSKNFVLGDNLLSIDVELNNGEHLSQDVNIKVFSNKKESPITFSIVKEYPHDATNFTQGFQLENNTIYESTGQLTKSKMMKYPLGSIVGSTVKKLADDVFGEGSCLVFDKIYQLSWENKKGFIYNKNSLELISEFAYPEVLKEGWGITFDGENLIVSDGSSQLFFLDYHNPEKLVNTINVAGTDQTYDQLNELEYHNGYIYANVWQQPLILKIDPKTGEVVGKMDLTELYKKNTKGDDDVLNGISFKGENMLVTGKYWPTIYELKWK